MNVITKNKLVRFFTTSKGNKIIAASIGLVVVVVGITLVQTRASGFFAGIEGESGTASANAKIITDSSASSGKAIQFTAAATTPPPTTGMRALPDPLYGVTVDDVSNVANIVASSKSLAHTPTTRIVFDDGVAASSYVSAVNQIQPVSYIMGELLDSEGLKANTLKQYHDRTASYLSTLGSKVDLWEIGNEVNGNWTGPYADVSAKITDAYTQVKAAGKRSALTLWYDAGCGNGPSELDPIAFSNQYVSPAMRSGLDYVLISYYETQCGNIRPTATTLTTFFNQLHSLYPNAKLGFGEVGFPNKVSATQQAAAISMINYYYGLKISTPGYIGGYFWWYYYEDMLPASTKPLWPVLNTALQGY